MSSSRTHWCYSCRQPVSLRGRNAVCSDCSGGFVQELNDELSMNQLSINSSEEDNVEHHEQRPGLVDSFLNFLRERIVGINNSVDSTRRSDSHPEQGGFSPWLIFSGQVPDNSRFEELFNEAGGFRRGNGGNYFVGPGLEELIEELTRDQRGSHPAPKSLIDAMPTIKISQKHCRSDAHCAVCKEKFKAGSHARKMPCDHIYHSDCIVPWLVQHNSCPVCRQELQLQRSDDGHSNQSSRAHSRSSSSGLSRSSSSGQSRSSSNRRNVNGMDNVSQNKKRWNPFSLFRSFGSFQSSSHNNRIARSNSSST